MVRGFCLFEETLLAFWGTGPKCTRMVHESSSSRSECNPLLACHLTRIKQLLLRHLCIDSSRGYSLVELNPARSKSLCISVRPQWPAAFPVTIADDLQRQAWADLQLSLLPSLRIFSSTTSQLLSALQSVTSCLLTQCQPLYAGCCSVVLHFSRYCSVRFKMFSFSFVFAFYALFVQKLL